MLASTRTTTVLLALAQIWIIVMGALASGLHGRFTQNEFEALPFASALLRDAGFSLLWIPFAWVCIVTGLQIRAEVSDELRSAALHVGWWLLLGTLVFVVYAVLRPWFELSVFPPVLE